MTHSPQQHSSQASAVVLLLSKVTQTQGWNELIQLHLMEDQFLTVELWKRFPDLNYTENLKLMEVTSKPSSHQAVTNMTIEESSNCKHKALQTTGQLTQNDFASLRQNIS